MISIVIKTKAKSNEWTAECGRVFGSPAPIDQGEKRSDESEPRRSTSLLQHWRLCFRTKQSIDEDEWLNQRAKRLNEAAISGWRSWSLSRVETSPFSGEVHQSAGTLELSAALMVDLLESGLNRFITPWRRDRKQVVPITIVPLVSLCSIVLSSLLAIPEKLAGAADARNRLTFPKSRAKHTRWKDVVTETEPRRARRLICSDEIATKLQLRSRHGTQVLARLHPLMRAAKWREYRRRERN
ncbi:hypothetical protein VNO77_15087 [Canavalia gladiata]|uniref:Uncharacterized protein n=1 Tax=Canavalia gladiata TaxID=3824 RepID=A0AAN9QR81_CANGL